MHEDKKKMTWIIMEPVDTLFFRGAESMVAGENHEVDTLFPPMPQTLVGAIRTAVMGQKGITPKAYKASPEEHPFLGQPDMPGFTLVGPLFLCNGTTLLLPVPANWYADLPDELLAELDVQAATPLQNNTLGLKGSNSAPFWVHKPLHDDLKPLAGWWATTETINVMAKGHASIPVVQQIEQLPHKGSALLPQTALYDREERLGIALTERRTAKDGHLYTTVHIRLRPGLELAAGIVSQHKIPLDSTGIIQLGGEQRMCRYRLSNDIDIPVTKNGQMVMTLSPLAIEQLSKEHHDCSRASGKLFRIGGWDMKTGFHKPMRAWLPAGTVFGHKPATEPDELNFISI